MFYSNGNTRLMFPSFSIVVKCSSIDMFVSLFSDLCLSDLKYSSIDMFVGPNIFAMDKSFGPPCLLFGCEKPEGLPN